MKNFITIGFGLALTAGVCAAADDTRTGNHFQTQSVKRGSLPVVVETSGTIEPELVVDVGAQVAGTIQQFGPDLQDRTKAVTHGTLVRKGTILAQLDPAPHKMKLVRAEADLKRAQAGLRLAQAQVILKGRELQRVLKRQAARAAEAADVEVARAALDVVRASVRIEEAAVAQQEVACKQAELNLWYTTIRSPIDGVVVERRCRLGQSVRPSLQAASLFLIAADLKKVQVWAVVKEADIGRVDRGQLATFTLEAYPNLTFKGQVAQIRLNATLRKGVVTYTVEIDADNRDGKLLPYMTANVRILAGEKKNVLLVPNAALQWRPRLQQVAKEDRVAFVKWERSGGPVVWVEEKGFVRLVRLKTGVTDGRRTEVLAGNLAEGTRVVTGAAQGARANKE
jgi:HlyD family secretion protein